ncbi:uncharacterized protein K452DRAFT_235658 [Aplosporella prunicola CBS 121167]|uniref:DUF3955 domain-containing protein n=1 Tax=Aplosporella prunicola CBS 121167 TaxID=1176127 RepID=A0A6A6B0X5_9PEZI|nr:uncharacterized protein K452DRAFT_235658 [Aplosporella prunicola CBS 121167]KAF2137506.1 hypothetical protein K452DRAFT_235658 [Aplosporella prunicola CBS 121167]
MGASESEGTNARWSGARPSRMTQGVRHSVGIALLLVTVVLWTASNFLASTIFADDSYSKPYFVTYVNTAFFVIPLIPILARKARDDPAQLHDFARAVQQKLGLSGAGAAAWYTRAKEREETVAAEEREAFIGEAGRDDATAEGGQVGGAGAEAEEEEGLDFMATAKLSIEFCCLWFLANYFTAACLHYTTVASSTILTSTSSIWTLLAGAFIGIERFTLRKLLGVLASLLGIVLISTVDISGTNSDDANRGSFPSKTPGELATGDALAFLSAVLYGFYAVTMKARIGDERRVSMPLFFGLVGLFNVLLLWPGLVVLHVTGIETFAMPPTGKIWAIVLINSTSSLVSDFCWAYAMLLTSPLVVTVGLSMTIPCSLIGQVLINGQTAHWAYWVGAAVVVGSFVFVNHEENRDEDADGDGDGGKAGHGQGLGRGDALGEGILAGEARRAGGE